MPARVPRQRPAVGPPVRLALVVPVLPEAPRGSPSPAEAASWALGHPADDGVLVLDRRASGSQPPPGTAAARIDAAVAAALEAARSEGRSRLVVLTGPEDPVAPAWLEGAVRLGPGPLAPEHPPRRLRLTALAEATGRSRNAVACDLDGLPADLLGRLLRARRVLLVEGPTDRAVLGTLVHRVGGDAAVLGVGSKMRLGTVHAVCEQLGVSHHVLFDGDGDDARLPQGSARRHRVLRSRREATAALLATLGPQPGRPGIDATAAGSPWRFGDPTAIGDRWSAFGADLEDELARWPSFLAALDADGAALRAKDPAALERAARRARLEDAPASLRSLVDAVLRGAADGAEASTPPGARRLAP